MHDFGGGGEGRAITLSAVLSTSGTFFVVVVVTFYFTYFVF